MVECSLTGSLFYEYPNEYYMYRAVISTLYAYLNLRDFRACLGMWMLIRDHSYITW